MQPIAQMSIGELYEVDRSNTSGARYLQSQVKLWVCCSESSCGCAVVKAVVGLVVNGGAQSSQYQRVDT